MISLDLDVATVAREDLPLLAGRLAEAQARVTMRLLETSAAPAPAPSRILLPQEAADMAGVSVRYLLQVTKGRPFRVDLSRKRPRLEESGFRSWLSRRKR